MVGKWILRVMVPYDVSFRGWLGTHSRHKYFLQASPHVLE
jgi:hypothetical protein